MDVGFSVLLCWLSGPCGNLGIAFPLSCSGEINACPNQRGNVSVFLKFYRLRQIEDGYMWKANRDLVWVCGYPSPIGSIEVPNLHDLSTRIDFVFPVFISTLFFFIIIKITDAITWLPCKGSIAWLLFHRSGGYQRLYGLKALRYIRLHSNFGLVLIFLDKRSSGRTNQFYVVIQNDWFSSAKSSSVSCIKTLLRRLWGQRSLTFQVDREEDNHLHGFLQVCFHLHIDFLKGKIIDQGAHFKTLNRINDSTRKSH